jgi:plasmid stability protein
LAPANKESVTVELVFARANADVLEIRRLVFEGATLRTRPYDAIRRRIYKAFTIHALGHEANVNTVATLANMTCCWHYESMAIQINIRDVPEKVRDELAARAALQGKSMQEFLRAELERLAARPSVDAWLQQVRKRKRAAQTRLTSKQILENRDADRR